MRRFRVPRMILFGKRNSKTEVSGTELTIHTRFPASIVTDHRSPEGVAAGGLVGCFHADEILLIWRRGDGGLSGTSVQSLLTIRAGGRRAVARTLFPSALVISRVTLGGCRAKQACVRRQDRELRDGRTDRG